MILRTGNMFDHIDECDVLLVTTNCIVKSNGELVMGSGAALQAKLYDTSLPRRLARKILEKGVRYGLIIFEDSKIGAFQTKYHFSSSAKYEIIAYSTTLLCDWVNRNKQKTVFLNYPGIGLGGLKEERVYRVISKLPDNVVVWKLQ